MKYIAAIFVLGFLSFSCAREVPEDLIDQRDGRVYRTVNIGDQTWMAENLAYMPYVSELAADSGIWVFGYDGKSKEWAKGLQNYKDFGCLYSWTAAMDVSHDYRNTWLGVGDSLHQGICPDGWHLPSDSEWQVLENFADTEPDFDRSDERRNSGNAGIKLKADSVWTENMAGTNDYNFNALPGGMRYLAAHFHKKIAYGYFWTSTEVYEKSAIYRYLWDSSEATFRGIPSKRLGLSVRCIKDD